MSTLVDLNGKVIVDRDKLVMWFSELSYFVGFIGVVAPEKYDKINNLKEEVKEVLYPK